MHSQPPQGKPIYSGRLKTIKQNKRAAQNTVSLKTLQLLCTICCRKSRNKKMHAVWSYNFTLPRKQFELYIVKCYKVQEYDTLAFITPNKGAINF